MGFFEHFPYTNFHDLNLDWLLKKMKELASKVEELMKAKVPGGGNAGQVLTKLTNADYAMDWRDVPKELPQDGTDGQVLTKVGAEPGACQWRAGGGAANGLPAGGTQGQTLVKKSNKDYDAEWRDQAAGGSVPPGGTTGQALTKASNADYDATWQPLDYLPLEGGLMDPDAWIKLQEAGGNSLKISPRMLEYQGTDTAKLMGNWQVVGSIKGNTPTQPAELATKQYVDDQVGQGGGSGSGDYLPLAGGTMTPNAKVTAQRRDPNYPDVGPAGYSTIVWGDTSGFGKDLGFAVESGKDRNLRIVIGADIGLSTGYPAIEFQAGATGPVIEVRDSYGDIQKACTVLRGTMYFDGPKVVWGQHGPQEPDDIVSKRYVDEAIAGAKAAIAASLSMKGYTGASASGEKPKEV